MDTEIKTLLLILEKLLIEEISCEVAHKRIEALSMLKLPKLYGNLHHYYLDEDARKEDSEYKLFQNNELKKLIYHLKIEDINKANDISFLHTS